GLPISSPDTGLANPRRAPSAGQHVGIRPNRVRCMISQASLTPDPPHKHTREDTASSGSIGSPHETRFRSVSSNAKLENGHPTPGISGEPVLARQSLGFLPRTLSNGSDSSGSFKHPMRQPQAVERYNLKRTMRDGAGDGPPQSPSGEIFAGLGLRS